MATFTWIPDYEATENSRPRIRKVQFGDGYEQRLKFGPRTDPKEWDLVFMGRTNTERDEITDFLSARGGVESFDWTPPNQQAAPASFLLLEDGDFLLLEDGGKIILTDATAGQSYKWVCEEWRTTLNVHNYNTVTATFRQVFEP